MFAVHYLASWIWVSDTRLYKHPSLGPCSLSLSLESFHFETESFAVKL